MSFLVLQNIWWALIMIGIMILIHELGHYWAARFFDVKVDTFSFGFGPRLFGFKKGETDFRFSAHPARRLRQDGGRATRRRARQRSAQLSEQASLAAFDHRLRRARHEHHPGRGGAHRALHGPLPQDSFLAFARDWLHRAQQRRRQSRLAGRRPHRADRRQRESHLGRHLS